jgi:hypothetical protein
MKIAKEIRQLILKSYWETRWHVSHDMPGYIILRFIEENLGFIEEYYGDNK